MVPQAVLAASAGQSTPLAVGFSGVERRDPHGSEGECEVAVEAERERTPAENVSAQKNLEGATTGRPKLHDLRTLHEEASVAEGQ